VGVFSMRRTIDMPLETLPKTTAQTFTLIRQPPCKRVRPLASTNEAAADDGGEGGEEKQVRWQYRACCRGAASPPS